MNVNDAIRALRQEFGDTQQGFAVRLGLAVSTVVKYEADRTPRGAELSRFLQLAIDKQRHDLTEVFALAIADELNMKAERIPRTAEESLCADLLFLMMRNRQDLFGHTQPPTGYAEMDRAFAEVRRQLIAAFEFLAGRYHRGKKVLLMAAISTAQKAMMVEMQGRVGKAVV